VWNYQLETSLSHITSLPAPGTSVTFMTTDGTTTSPDSIRLPILMAGYVDSHHSRFVYRDGSSGALNLAGWDRCCWCNRVHNTAASRDGLIAFRWGVTVLTYDGVKFIAAVDRPVREIPAAWPNTVIASDKKLLGHLNFLPPLTTITSDRLGHAFF